MVPYDTDDYGYCCDYWGESGMVSHIVEAKTYPDEISAEKALKEIPANKIWNNHIFQVKSIFVKE